MKTKYNIFKKYRLFLFLFFCLSFQAYTVYGQTTAIPDENFEQALIDQGFDSDGTINGHVLNSDIETVVELDVRFSDIADLTGIEGFLALENLNVRGNALTTLDTSNNFELRTLVCNTNPINTINLSNNILLKSLNFENIGLSSIDLSNNVNLEVLNMESTYMYSIDLSHNTALKTLLAAGSYLSEVNLSNNTLLENLDLTGVPLTEIALSNNIELKELYLGNFGGFFNQQVSSLNLTNNINLENLYAENLFDLNDLNVKNGNNEILSITLLCEIEGIPCELLDLNCVTVDDEDAATNNEPPYNSWYIAADIIYSEDCTLGIADQNSIGFSIYPNPVKDILYIENKTVAINSVTVYDVMGKILLNINGNANEINMSKLPKGMFFVKIETGKGTVTRKIIKQ